MKLGRFIISAIAFVLALTESGAARTVFYPMDVVPQSYIEANGIDEFFTCEYISDELFDFMWGRSYHESCSTPRRELRYLRILHKNLQGQSIVGELVVNESVAEDILEIFKELYQESYPVEKVRLIDWYDGDDEASMRDNNTSAFNSRNISHTSLVSRHELGLAIDINPLYNPFHKINKAGIEILEPATGKPYLDRSKDFRYKIEYGDICHRLFIKHGFIWGGGWANSKDYQHFER